LSIEIERSVLESACKEMIETILFCLPGAFKGTIYRVGKPPALITERITSGVIDLSRKQISWGLPESSYYNPPGRPWIDYRDEPGRPLEAMAWCVEKQMSWTSADPRTDPRSVRLQVEGIEEDYHHLEPVLVRKSDLHFDIYSSVEYPRDSHDRIIWQGSDYVVVAVVKIHFDARTIRVGSPETKVIKKLSRSLGTQLLSHHLHHDTVRAMQQLARDRLNACNILADSLRNTITKSALIFSLVKMEMWNLREQWEAMLLKDRQERNGKREAVKELEEILTHMSGDTHELRKDLAAVQRRFLDLPLSPGKAEKWITMQVQERWKELLEISPQDEKTTRRIWQTMEKLKKSLYYGRNPEVVAGYPHIPRDLKEEWVEAIYSDVGAFSDSAIDRLIRVLANPALAIPSRERSRRMLTLLKVLAENMDQLERNTNFLLRHVLNGGANGFPLDPSNGDKEKQPVSRDGKNP
jgi:chemotaxis regulatin CheY-phosphate phosphatase CheZ